MSELIAPLEWNTEKRKVKDLIPYEYNPRILSEEKKQLLINSIEKFNLAEIPAINTDNKIIAGHQRIKILMLLGRGEEIIDVRVPDRKLTDEEYKQYNITSNVSVGYWDIDVLEEHFSDINLEELGLNLEEIDIPFDLLPEEFSTEEEEEFEPEVPVEPISKKGDVYELTSKQKQLTHRVVCGDSTESSSYELVLPSELIDLVVTDPPYNVDYDGGSTQQREKIENDNLSDSNFLIFLNSTFNNIYSNTKHGASIYVFHADTEGLNFRQSFSNSGFKLSQCLIWKKNSIVMSRQDYHWIHEPCLYGWKEGSAHSWYNDRKQRTVLEFDRPTKSEEHPTMKPVDLLSYLILNSSKKRQIVFDGFLGSGFTLIASEKNWRQCRGIEFSPGYVDVSVKRWIKYMIDNKLEYSAKENGIEIDKETIQLFLNNNEN